MKLAWRELRPAARGVVVSFVLSGTIHLVRPRVFDPLIPPALPAPRAWIVGTGAAELASAAGLLTGRPWGGRAATATLLLVWPGNWWHAVHTQRSRAHPAVKAVVWLRLPLQIPMIRAALDPYGRAADDASPTDTSATMAASSPPVP